MVSHSSPSDFDLSACTEAVLSTLLGPQYVAHWTHCAQTVKAAIENSGLGWTSGEAIGATFIAWLANAGEHTAAVVEAMAVGGDLSSVTISSVDQEVTISPNRLGDWPWLAPLIRQTAPDAAGLVLVSPASAILTEGVFLNEGAGGASTLTIVFRATTGAIIRAVYGTTAQSEPLISTERKLSGPAVRAIAVALNQMYAAHCEERQDASHHEAAPIPADDGSNEASRYGAVGPEMEGAK